MDELQKEYRVETSRFYYDYADGLAIVIDSATGTYYGMNVLGSAVFDQLVHGAAPAEVLDQLRQMTGCPLQIEQTFIHFLSQVRDFGLLVAEEKQGKPAQSFDEKVTADGFLLEVKEFAEIQEILLADPIHDVQSDFGWPVLKN
jgi:hypothetical protein